MSVERAHEFMAFVRTRADLQQRLEALRGASALDALVAIAAEEGYAFTVEAYRSAVAEDLNEELSDASLNALLGEMGLEKKVGDSGDS